MIVQAFCELFVAGCLEVRHQDGAGLPHTLFKVIDDVDVSLLSPAEQVVARCLGSFKSFRDLLDGVGKEVPEARQELVEQCACLIDDALAYCPPVSSCSP